MLVAREWPRSETVRFLRVPNRDDDKYSRGVVAVRTGTDAYPGAAVLGVEAAWRAGAGFVKFVGGGPAGEAVIARRPETVVASDIGRTRADAWVIGSGTDAAERTADEDAALRTIVTGDVPVIVDAGALDLATVATAPILLTPHAGEFARLRQQLEMDADGSGDRAADAAEVAAALGQTVLLKGATTLVASPDHAVISISSAPGWLATAGAGDVLAGVLGALIAANPKMPLAEVAAAGAWLHGYAATRAAAAADGRVGHPIVALDVAEALPMTLGELLS